VEARGASEGRFEWSDVRQGWRLTCEKSEVAESCEKGDLDDDEDADRRKQQRERWRHRQVYVHQVRRLVEQRRRLPYRRGDRWFDRDVNFVMEFAQDFRCVAEVDMLEFTNGPAHRGGFDAKLLERPAPVSGRDEDWPDWKFSFMNWLAVVDPKFETLCSHAEHMQEVLTQQDHPTGGDELYRLQCGLCSILATLVHGKTLKLVKATPRKNGF